MCLSAFRLRRFVRVLNNMEEHQHTSPTRNSILSVDAKTRKIEMHNIK